MDNGQDKKWAQEDTDRQVNKKKKEQAYKEKLEQEKCVRLILTESLCNSFSQKKNKEMCIQKEMKKLRLEDKKRKQREIKTLAKKKAADAETFENL